MASIGPIPMILMKNGAEKTDCAFGIDYNGGTRFTLHMTL